MSPIAATRTSTSSSIPAADTSRPTLRKGSKNTSAVKELQALLTNAGFSCAVDGAFGPKTDQAVRNFQRAKGLAVDGVVGNKTWQALLGAQSPTTQTPTTQTPTTQTPTTDPTSSFEPTTATLRKGSTGEAVVELQTILKNRGFFSGAADGSFGTETVAAVKSFQRAAGLTADGVVGPRTWAKLRSTEVITPPAAGQPGAYAAYEAFPIAGDYKPLRNNFNPTYENGVKTHKGHHGIDMYAAAGTPIVAPCSGKVIKAHYEEYGGWVVTIRRADNVTVRFGHLGMIPEGITPGMEITAGTQVGTMGKSGTGANGVVHLHFSMYRGNDYYDSINPYPYLKAAQSLGN